MRLTATLALVFCASASAEITVDENATRAKLVNNSTWVFLAIHNQFEKPVDTRVELEWLDPENTRRGRTQFAFTAKPGSSIAEAALPVNPTDDPLFFRLHYSVSADTRNLTAFSPIRGMISFPIIAEHGFRLTAAGIGVARLGQPYEFHVFASHPITLAPVADVQITLDDKPVARTGADGTAVVRLMLATDDWEYPDNITFHGRLGDLVQETEAWHPGVMPNDVRICTDKPLYQPGQTVHVRILALGSDGKARSGAEYGIEISDERSTTVHSADLKTSQYGIAHTDWEVPANAANGKYEIELEDKDAGITYQRYVEIRRYELPSFRVTVRLDRSYYLSGQNAIAEVRADYLFGKSLSAGSVRICAAENDTALHEGSLGLGGTFHATLDLAAAREDLGDARFADLHYVAYVTDAGTNRTEKRPFDVRISRAPIHIYVLSRDRAALWRPLYVMTYTPDGKPAASDVEALVDGQVLGSGKTNRFGLARLSIPPNTSGEITVRARASEGQATQTEQVWPGGLEVRLETDRVLYVAGQPVRCRITSPRHDLHATLLAWNRRGDVLFSKPLHLKKGSAEAVIPYDARFGREVTIEILSPLGDDYQTGRTILYPGAEDLQIIAAPGAGSYRPGDEATLTVRTASSSGSPARSALGVAVVDESVFERVAGDTANRRHGWFDSGYESRESKIGGFGITDLLNLDPARIDADLQLVAEALLDSQPVAPSGTGTFLEEQASEYSGVARKALDSYRITLDKVYQQTLEYPRTEEELKRMAVGGPTVDPWLRPYRLEFTTEGPDDVLRFMSGGPDKSFGTDDDFVGLTMTRPWFAPTAAMIRKTLDRQTDYPATVAEFGRLLSEDGLRLDRLKDPWGSPVRVAISHFRDRRIIEIRSPGPDRIYGNRDDCTVTTFSGSYFHELAAKINRVLGIGADFPTDEAQLRSRISSAGVDLRTERDPWGRPYYPTLRTEATFSDRYQVYTYAEYQGVAEERKQVIPTKRRFLVAEIHSSGEDGIANTYDDFVLVQFTRVITEDQQPHPAFPAPSSTLPSMSLGGRGTITGVISDPNGAVVPGAEVVLNDTYRTQTDDQGRYDFRGVPEGKYTVRVWLAGFTITVIGGVPVQPDRVTRLDAVLSLGQVTETVEVAASPTVLETASASVASKVVSVNTLTSTPRLREYFPETLYWAPEVITDSDGRTVMKFKLADSITTWRVAVMASTTDGRIAEAATDIKAFQPFFVDLDPPQVLTVADEISLPVPIRNYLTSDQAVAVNITAPPALQLSGRPTRQERISANSSVNTAVVLRASATAPGARLRVTAQARGGNDAIEKPIAIHPDGESVSRAISDLLNDGRLLRIDVPANAIPGSVRAEVKVYPNVLAHVIESMESLLRLPSGCAEQIISSSYSNLLFLRALKISGLQDAKLEERARRNLEAGYRRLLSYRKEQGAFGYWSNSPADIAVTAYAVTFLEDASKLIAVDQSVIDQARSYLSDQSPADLTVRSVALRAIAKAGPKYETAVIKRLGELARSPVEFEDPYTLSTFVLAALDAGRPELALPAVDRLRESARDEQGAAWWSLRRNTPYYGWGRAGIIETTALAVTALAEWQAKKGSDPSLSALVDRGIVFLLRNKESRGVWLTGQATVRVFEALIRVLAAPEEARASAVELQVNGLSAGRIPVPEGRSVRGPATVDVSRLIKPGMANEVSLAASGGRLAAQVQFAADWYQPWDQPRTFPDFSLDVRYATTEAGVNDIIRCDVTVSRPAFRGYGMMIAEVGLPPGAEVDRSALSAVLDGNYGVGSFEVAPDRVVFYVWPRAADSKFSFTFRLRFPMRARTASSALYDYYNPEARVVLPPATFSVK